MKVSQVERWRYYVKKVFVGGDAEFGINVNRLRPGRLWKTVICYNGG